MDLSSIPLLINLCCIVKKSADWKKLLESYLCMGTDTLHSAWKRLAMCSFFSFNSCFSSTLRWWWGKPCIKGKNVLNGIWLCFMILLQKAPVLSFATIKQVGWNFKLIIKILWLFCEASRLRSVSWRGNCLNQIHTKECVEHDSEYYLWECSPF